MTSPPSPPNRRRRRIVVAVAVLLLVSLVLWWNWPRGDARFVGKWRVHTAGQGKPIDCELIVSSNGAAMWLRSNKVTRTTWNVDGSTLSFGVEPDGWLRNAVLQASLWASKNGGQLNLTSEQWVIDSISPDEIRMHFRVAPDIQSELTRIPE
jgi:hypothetical protein